MGYMKVIKNKKYLFILYAVVTASTLLYIFPPHFEAVSAEDCSGGCTKDGSVEGETTFSVNVQETLSMTVTPEAQEGATGNTDTFLRNKITVAVASNNGQGFTAGMTTKTADTSLAHINAEGTPDSKGTIPTLTSTTSNRGGSSDTTYAGFPANNWGYSLDDGEGTGTYSKLVGVNDAPITVLSSKNAETSASSDVYFGAKADKSKAAGTYKGTVVFTVTSGTQGSPLLPQGPAGDPGSSDGPQIADNPQTSEAPSYVYTTNNRTYQSYNYSSAASAGRNATEDSQKKTTAGEYAAPLGAIERSASNIQTGSPIARILMIVAFSAAGVGIVFFVLAKRRKDDEDEETIR